MGGAFCIQRIAWFDSGFARCLLELFELSALLGSTVALGEDFVAMFVFIAMRGSTVALGDDFMMLVVLSAVLGSTVCLHAEWLVQQQLRYLR